MLHHQSEIRRVEHPLAQPPGERQHGAVLVGKGFFQCWDAVSQTLLFVLRPNRIGKRFLLITPVRVGDVDHGLRVAREEEGCDSVNGSDLELWVKFSEGLDRAAKVSARLDENIYVVGRTGAAGPTADAVSACENKR